ncbi:hypothetical protein [Streptomyces sp. NPDC047028]|uniref:hypothetical protein n=1 Tax=Streptomyces sp. NPDC047028 TaxID=3155793 RepID=UPI0033C71DCE
MRAQTLLAATILTTTAFLATPAHATTGTGNDGTGNDGPNATATATADNGSNATANAMAMEDNDTTSGAQGSVAEFTCVLLNETPNGNVEGTACSGPTGLFFGPSEFTATLSVNRYFCQSAVRVGRPSTGVNVVGQDCVRTAP